MATQIGLIGSPSLSSAGLIAAMTTRSADAEVQIEPANGEVPHAAAMEHMEPMYDAEHTKEVEARLVANLSEQAPGGDHMSMPNKAMIRNYVLQRNVQIQRELDRELSTDDKAMISFSEQLTTIIEAELLKETTNDQGKVLNPSAFIGLLGDFVVINRRNGFYELETYYIMNNPTNPLPTTKRLKTYNVNRLLLGDSENNPFMETFVNGTDDFLTYRPIIDLSPLKTLHGKTTGILQSVTVSVHNLVTALRTKRWGVVTLCPDATELKSYKPLLIKHPTPSLGLNGLLAHCQKNNLSTRPRKAYAEYLANQKTA